MISVIIPAFNEEKLLKNPLASLLDQNYKGKYEVLVVNNNSTDNTEKVFNDFKKSLPENKRSIFRIYFEKRQGRGNARATGMEQAKGDILAFIDADTVVNEDWLTEIDEIFSDKKVAAATGPWIAVEVDGFKKWFLDNFQEILQLPYVLVRTHFWLNGMNMIIRRSAYDKTSGFDRDLNAHEDIDITEKLRKHGKIVYSKKIKVTVVARRFKDGLLVGYLDYIKPFIQKYIFGKKRIELIDRR